MLTRFLYMVIACTLAASFFCPKCMAQEDKLSPESVIEFARYLRDEGDYKRAEGEYNRYIALTENTGQHGAALLEIGDCYRLDKNYDKAAAYYQEFIDANPEDAAVDSAKYRIAAVNTEGGMYAKSLEVLDRWAPKSQDYLTRQRWLRSTNYLYLKQWDKARAELKPNVESAEPDKQTAGIEALASRGMALKRKSAATAALLSAVMPGAGKVYAGRTSDGLNSFLSILLAAKAGSDAFRRDGNGSTRAWIYSGLALGYYLGDIYGSAASVRLRNETQERNLLGDISVTVNLPLD